MIVNGYEIGPDKNLGYADLAGKDLSGADLTGTRLYRAILNSVDLSGAKLSNADLEGADLGRANLRGANLRDADLELANLAGADLRDADLSGADLSSAILHGADLRDANLSGAKLGHARFYCADLTGVVLSDSQLEQAKFSGAIMPGGQPSYKNIATDVTLRDLGKQVARKREIYHNNDPDHDYEEYVDAAEALIFYLYRYVERVLDIVNPRGAHRDRVIAQLEMLAVPVLHYTDNDTDTLAMDYCDEIIVYLDETWDAIVNLHDSKAGKADLPAFLSEIGFRIDVEVKVTPKNRERIIARLDQLASDVANLAGISKEETPAKTVLAAIEVSNLTPEIMELVSDAVLDCAEMG